MSGRVKQLIDELMELRGARHAPGVAHFVRAHLVINGIDPARYTADSPDDPPTQRRLEQMISDFSQAQRRTP